MTRPVVITSMGVVSSLGNESKAMVNSIARESVAFRRSDFDPGIVIAPVEGFNIRQYTGRHKNIRYLNRGAKMAVAAALNAVESSGLNPEQCEKMGLFVGAGPNLDLGTECQEIKGGKIADEKLQALWILKFLPNTAASTIAQLAGIHGENLTIGNACAASLQAVGDAFRKVRDGYLDIALAGGGDSRLSAGGLLAYQKANALYKGPAEPDKASRPFDMARRGFVPGEGGAFFVFEAADHAVARKATILAEVCGYGASLDGHAMTAPQPDGKWAERAVCGAMNDAGLGPDQIDMISAHGTGTPLNDKVEADMIQRVFGCHPAVLAIKSWIGHLAAACGAVELAVCLGALQTGVWPYIRNLDNRCNDNLNYLSSKAAQKVDTVLIQNFGFGGQNAALVFRQWKQ